MKLRTFAVVVGLFFVAFSCTPKTEQSEESKIEDKEVPQEQRELMALYDEVIDIHDEVMPKMNDLMQAKGALQEKLDTLKANDPNNVAIPELVESIKSLADADEAMMDWMRNFKPQDDVNDHNVALNYYKEEKEKIQAVKDQMLTALEEAQRITKKEE